MLSKQISSCVFGFRGFASHEPDADQVVYDGLISKSKPAAALAKAGEDKRVYIYVTGLTPAVIAALNVLRQEGAEATLMHYGSSTLNCKPQRVY